jgi:DNA-binding transcriptional ArsR family regulator
MDCALKAIADPRRRAILRSLRGGSLSAEALDTLRAAQGDGLVEQLRVLRRAGLLRELPGREGVRYALAADRLHELAVFLRTVVAEV